MTEPVFVVGVGRSGTSLLQSMLAMHPALAFPPETGFVRAFVASRRLERILARRGWAGVDAALREDSRVGRLGIDPVTMLAPFRDGAQEFTGVSLYERILVLFQERAGKPRVGDKDPRLLEFLPLVRRWWPDARILQVVRDPRDVLVSKKKAAWSRAHPSLRHVFANRVQMRIGEREGRRLFGDRYRTVRYEDLLASPEVVLAGIAQWLGVDYDRRMLNFSQAAQRLVSEAERAWKAETLGPLLSDNHGRWRTELGPFETRLTEIACRAHFEHFGYTVSNRREPLVEVAAQGCGAALVASEPAYRLVRWFRQWRSR